MPELPEVETLRRRLAPAVVGERVTQAELLAPKLFAGGPGFQLADVEGATIVDLRRRAKYLIFDLTNQLSLVLHLGMTGQLICEPIAAARIVGGHPYPPFDTVLPHQHTRVILRLERAVLYLTDLRLFAHVWVVPTDRLALAIPEERLGPEIQSEAFTVDELRRRLQQHPKTRLKPLLLDQAFLAGLGNIYVDESLWGARLHPLRPAGSLSDAEVAALHDSIRFVIDLALTTGVAEIYQSRAVPGARLPRIHARAGEPCPRCGATIEKTRVVGRGTYTCSACQVL
jgi:formamidopyrimidine-DNA glycosylase